MLTNAAAGTYTVSILGFTNTVTYATSPTNTVDLLVTAINGNANLKGIVVASNTTGDLTLTSLTDGAWTPTLSATGAGNSAANTATATGTAGTTAVDNLNGGAGADVIVGGGGADVLTGGAGADTFFMLKGHSTLAATATITDFTFATGGTSNDKLILGDQVAVIGTTATVQDLSSQVSIQAAMDAAATTNVINNGLSVFIWGGNSYAFVETTGSGTSYVSTDFVVKLTGLPLAAGATIAGSGFDAV